MLGMFAPALAAILCSAMLGPGPREGSRKAGAIAFVVAWIVAALLIALDQALNEGRAMGPGAIIACAAAALAPAFVVSSVFFSAPGVRRLLASLVRPKGPVFYYVLAAVLFIAIWGVGALLSRALGMPVPQRALPASAGTIGAAGAVALGFFYTCIPNALAEEVGWRGFALPRMLRRRSPLAASLLLWVLWALWHAPAYYGGFEAQSVPDMIAEFVMMLPVTIVFTWLYVRTKWSLLATALLHPAMNTATRYLPITLVGLALLVLFTVFVVVRDRMWRALPGQ